MRRSLLRFSVAIVVGLAAVAFAAVATGRVHYVVTNGVSMNPVYYEGDLVLVEPADHYGIGDIVAYRSESKGMTVLHRIVAGDERGWQTKGDNNASTDPDMPTSDAIIGRAFLHIPKAGVLIASPLARIGFALVVALIVYGVATVARRSRSKHPGGTAGSPVPAPAAKGPVHQRVGRWVLVGLDAVLLVALAAAILFPPTPAPPPPMLNAHGALRYGADVRRSDTYPTGRIETGDPVFTRIADSIDLDFDLSTDAAEVALVGGMQLDLDVTNAEGWHQRISLAPRSEIADSTLTISATMDVAEIQRVAANVAKATGLGAGLLQLGVVASGSATVGDAAEPTDLEMVFTFALNELVLSYDGSPTLASADGPFVELTQPIAIPVQNPPSPSGISADARRNIGIASLLCIGLTVTVWPSNRPDDGSEDASGGAAPVPTTHVLHVQVPKGTAWVRVASRRALEDIAALVERVIVHHADGWEGVLTGDVLYWFAAAEPEESESGDERDTDDDARLEDQSGDAEIGDAESADAESVEVASGDEGSDDAESGDGDDGDDGDGGDGDGDDPPLRLVG